MRKNLDLVMNKPGTKIVILTMTNNCNLSCSYCYEHNKKLNSMQLETALKIVDYEMNLDDGTNFVCIYYFGGEPFLAFNTIKKIHKYLQNNTWEKGWFGFATTNGTLVRGEIQEWLHANQSSIELYLSIDGNREMHNQNRSNSYDRIDIDFFVKEFPFAKMTISNETLPRLSEGVIDLHRNGFQVSANLGYGIPWSKNSTEILAEQLQILIDFYILNPQFKPATILDHAVLDLNPSEEPPKRFCGVGPRMKSYDVDGEVYPCHAFAPLCVGKEKSMIAKKIDFSCPLNRSELDDKCKKCPVVGYCPTCYGINLNKYNNIYHVSDDHCKMMKVQFLANAKFKYCQYMKGQLKLTPSDELKLLRNIKVIQTLRL